ncbi:MAG: ABC transporter ATP-binding protein, partial [Oscillospiraceae bacterium]|nr:ABC transporter ATP-binding protein [Oscillospiraceae bacterium]
MGERILELSGIYKTFDGMDVLNGINLYIEKNEFLTLLGPSGCGKTTLLRIIGGFLTPTQGDIFYRGKRINDVPPHKRNINTVFQRYALFPKMTVGENIAFGPNIKKWDKKKIDRDVDEMLELVSLRGFRDRDVTTLSGGQQQRVAVA